MKIGVSNLLFTPDHDETIAALLARHRVDTIDVAPSRYFSPSADAAASDWRAIARRWRQRGIRITALQSLLHGTEGAALFGDAAARARLSTQLLAMVDAAAALGATALVFGSWQNRLRGSRPLADAIALAAETFRPLARAAAARGIRLTVEPIFAGYGNDFLTTHAEALQLVEAVAEPGFALTLDAGCLALANEPVADVIAQVAHRVAHIQLAERDLRPLDPGNPAHAAIGPALQAAFPGHVACIEALAPAGMAPAAAVEQSLAVADRHYR